SVTILPYETELNDLAGGGKWRSLLYPFFFFIQGSWTHVRILGLSMSALLLGLLGFVIWKRNWRVVGCICTVLFLAALRVGMPGTTYYGAFHSIVWFGLLLGV